MPATAQVGSRGSWYTQDCYTSSAKTTRTGTVSVSYSVDADTATSALFKVATSFDTTTGVTVPATSTYRVTSTGTVTRLNDVISLSANGVSLNLTITYL